ncbi:ankyrin repeat domain-containing protein [Nocardioides carbamazepini]|nr:ankyrin repeat domain-containing protein [Nocardioides carbamazepini]
MTDANDPQRRTRLHQVAVEGDVSEVSALVAAGVDLGAVDKSGATALHLACQQDNVEVASVLLEAGAPVDPPDASGNTPLWRAAFGFGGGDPALIRLLLAAGANPDAENDSGRSRRTWPLPSTDRASGRLSMARQRPRLTVAAVRCTQPGTTALASSASSGCQAADELTASTSRRARSSN